ncbi:hypothetical protein V5799_019831 [Amblyomma americanum]|uniref:Secreted protein n=1 Tax=Amblyomma americanum TaxID=6943 RepID=A0AAQ4EVT1_AMBAM
MAPPTCGTHALCVWSLVWRLMDSNGLATQVMIFPSPARRTDTPWRMQHGLLHSLRSAGLRHIHQNGKNSEMPQEDGLGKNENY